VCSSRFMFETVESTFFFLFFFSSVFPIFSVQNNIFINRDEFATSSQVLGRFMTKSINCHGILRFVPIIANP
jgi:hypothetical protein